MLSRSESKYFATAARMDEAFLALLEKKNFAYITVKEICAAAGVNRSTFYLHYETLSDLLAESTEHMTRQFQAYMAHDSEAFIAKLRTCPQEELYLVTPEYLTPYLRYIREHRRLFRTAMENAQLLGLSAAYDRMFRHVLTPILDRCGKKTIWNMALHCTVCSGIRTAPKESAFPKCFSAGTVFGPASPISLRGTTGQESYNLWTHPVLCKCIAQDAFNNLW